MELGVRISSSLAFCDPIARTVGLQRDPRSGSHRGVVEGGRLKEMLSGRFCARYVVLVELQCVAADIERRVDAVPAVVGANGREDLVDVGRLDAGRS